MPKAMILVLLNIVLVLFHCNDDLTTPPQDFRSISGTICAAHNNTAIPEVTIELIGSEGSVVTDSSGHFTLSNLPEGTVSLLVKKEHYAQHQETFHLIGTQHIIMDTLKLNRDFCIITGIITHSLKGNPVADAEVHIVRSQDNITIDSTITDTTGYFYFNYLTPLDTGYRISLIKPGFQTSTRCTVAKAGDSIFITEMMIPYICAKGRIFESDSITPISGATISLGSKTAMSDNLGSFILSKLIPSDTQYCAVIAKDGYASLNCSLSLGMLDTIVLNGYLKPQLGILGLVYESDSITPVESVAVNILDTVIYSNSLGQFSYKYLTPIASGYQFTFSKPGYSSIVVSDTIQKNDTTIGPVYMSKLCGHIQGTITLQGQTDYRGSVIYVNNVNNCDTTDKTGNFQIMNIPIGNYTLTINKGNFQELLFSVLISNNDTIHLDTSLIIQSGTINTSVNWTTTHSPYIIKDTLQVMESGSLVVDPGVHIKLQENAKLAVDGYFTSLGTPDNFTIISPGSSAGANTIEINGKALADTVMKYTFLLNLKTILKNGPKIANCIFAFNQDPGTDNMLHLVSSSDTTYLNHCEFFRYTTNRDPILIQDSLGAAGTVITNSIFSIFGNSSTYTNFLKSQNLANNIQVKIKNCDFYSENPLPYNVLTQINSDTTQVYKVDPLYQDPSNLNLELQATSTLRDKSTTGGKLGVEIVSGRRKINIMR